MYAATLATLAVLTLATIATLAIAILYSLVSAYRSQAPCAAYGTSTDLGSTDTERLALLVQSVRSATAAAPQRKARPTYRNLPNAVRARPVTVTPCYSRRTASILLGREFDSMVADFDVRQAANECAARFQSLRFAS
jgi:hypothetical protein